jgi:hypothetical protein
VAVEDPGQDQSLPLTGRQSGARPEGIAEPGVHALRQVRDELIAAALDRSALQQILIIDAGVPENDVLPDPEIEARVILEQDGDMLPERCSVECGDISPVP